MVQPSILKRHKPSKVIETHFYRLYSIIDWLQNHCPLSVKSMTPNFVVVDSVLLPIYCHINWGMPNLCIFVEEVATCLGAVTDIWL